MICIMKWELEQLVAKLRRSGFEEGAAKKVADHKTILTKEYGTLYHSVVTDGADVPVESLWVNEQTFTNLWNRFGG